MMICRRVLLTISAILGLVASTQVFPINTFGEFPRVGTVVDQENEPLEGVLVVAQWEQCVGRAHCTTTCTGYEVATTDKHGNYLIAGRHPGSLKVLEFYLSGFLLRGMQDRRVTLVRDQSTGKQRLDNLRRLVYGCRWDEAEPGLARVARAVLDETVYGLWDEQRFDLMVDVMDFIEGEEIGELAEQRSALRRRSLYDLPPNSGASYDKAAFPAVFTKNLRFAPSDRSNTAADSAGNSKLINSTFEGSLDDVRKELKKGISPDHSNVFGETPLFAAALSGHADVVDLLLEYGADADAPNVFGEAPILATLRGKHGDIAKRLLEKGANVAGDTGTRAALWAVMNDDVVLLERLLATGVPDNGEVDGWTPVHLAVRFGSSRIVKSLLEGDAVLDETTQKQLFNRALWQDTDFLLRALLENGYVVDKHDTNWPLGQAIERRNGVAVALLLQHGADVDRPLENGRTPLIHALNSNDKGVAEILLKAGADVNYVDPRGETALGVAARNGNVALMQILVEAGAKTDVGNPLKESLYAYRDVDNTATKWLLERGARPCRDRLQQQADLKAMAIAARKGKTWLIDEYVRHGCNVRLDHEGEILGEAIMGGDFETVERVVRLGAAINQQHEYGITPLMTAVDNGRAWDIKVGEDAKVECLSRPQLSLGSSANMTPPECSRVDMSYQAADRRIVRLLVDSGADVNRRDARFGMTALMRAAAVGNADVVALLIEAGADPEIKDKSGDTAYTHAARYGHRDVAVLLRSGKQ